jgi:alkanesulfonate monooxygenase SsuD/methylene tetrahydromethanopterin reductase-like flavin-dependent oxidoreductase (luciferase family)
MLAMAARHADGIMLSDITPDRVRRSRELIGPVLQARGLDPAAFPLNSFWAWHVKPTREAAEREARIYLAVRGTIWDPYIHDVVDPDEASLVLAHSRSFTGAYQRRSAEIPGVPDRGRAIS